MKTLVTFSLLILCANLLGGCSRLTRGEAADRDPFIELTAISYNIRVGFGPGDRGDRGEPTNYLDQITDWFEELEADILLLQEVDIHTSRAGDIDQKAYMAERMGFYGQFAPAIPLPVLGFYGVAVLSRWPITNWEVIELFKPDYSVTNPDYPEWYNEQRVLLVATVDSPAGPIHVLNTHLGLTEHQRKIQLEEIAAVLDRLPSGEPVIFGGDINAQPMAPEIDVIRHRLADAYEAGPQPLPIAERLTFHALDPNRCIDYIFVSPDMVRVQSVEVPRIELSDHLPVVARLRIDFPK